MVKFKDLNLELRDNKIIEVIDKDNVLEKILLEKSDSEIEYNIISYVYGKEFLTLFGKENLTWYGKQFLTSPYSLLCQVRYLVN